MAERTIFYFSFEYQAIREHTTAYTPTQLSQMEQWEALGGLNILQVKQYLSFTVTPLTQISLVRGGGRRRGPLPELGTSANNIVKVKIHYQYYLFTVPTSV